MCSHTTYTYSKYTVKYVVSGRFRLLLSLEFYRYVYKKYLPNGGVTRSVLEHQNFWFLGILGTLQMSSIPAKRAFSCPPLFL